MARKLKTYQTSLGFFDLAIAAPSMKAALEAWGADSNLFHQGAAKESDDPDVIAAAMESLASLSGARSDPTDRSASMPNYPPIWAAIKDRRKHPASRKGKKRRSLLPSPVDKAADRNATLAFEKEHKRRERERASEEAARERERERRQRAVDKAQAARWKPPSGSTRRKSRLSKSRWRLSRRDRGPKMPGGTRKRNASKPHCGMREARRRSTDAKGLITRVCRERSWTTPRRWPNAKVNLRLALGASIADGAKHIFDHRDRAVRRDAGAADRAVRPK